MKEIIFDTETTGLFKPFQPLSEQPEIVEFYGCVIDRKTNKIVDELDILIKPQNPIPDEVVKIHGITNEMVADADPFEAVCGKIRNIMNTARFAIAHNIRYDMRVLNTEFMRLGFPPLDVKQICTVQQTVHLKGRRLSLTDLHKHLFGEGFPEAHRAKNDVQALLKCYVEMKKLQIA